MNTTLFINEIKIKAVPTIMLVLFLFLLMSSCSRKFYAPNQVVVPNLTDQHDMAISAGLLSGNGINGFGIDVGYSPLKNLGIIADYSYFLSSDLDDRSYGHIWNFGVGTYIPTEKINWEIYAGYGEGFNHQLLGTGIGEWVDFNMRRFFAQASFTVPTKYFHFFAGLRVAGLDFYDALIISSEPQANLSDIEFIRLNTPFYLFEPTWGFRVGTPGLYFTLQRTSSFSQLNTRNFSSPMSSIGVQVTPELWRTKNTKQRVQF